MYYYMEASRKQTVFQLAYAKTLTFNLPPTIVLTEKLTRHVPRDSQDC